MRSPIISRIGNASTTSTLFWGVGANAGAVGVTGATASPMPEAGTLNGLSFILSGAPAPADPASGYRLRVVLNGVSQPGGIDVLGTALSVSDPTFTLSYAAGDLLAFTVSPVGTPTVTPTSLAFTENDSGPAGGQPILSSTVQTMNAGSSVYYGLQNSNPNLTLFDVVIPTDGVLDLATFRIGATSGPGAGKGYTATLVVNGVDTALVATVTGSALQATAPTGVSVAVAPGDLVHWRIDPFGTPTATRGLLSLRWTPNMAGENIWTAGAPNAMGNGGGANYSGVGTGIAFNTSAAIRSAGAPGAYVARSLRVRLTGPPGVGTSYTATLRSGATAAGAASAVAVTIADTATTGQDTTDSLALSLGDQWNVNLVGAGTPAAVGATWGLVLYAAPTGGPNYVDSAPLDMSASSDLAAAGTVDAELGTADMSASSDLAAAGTVDAAVTTTLDLAASSDLAVAGTLLTGPPLLDVAATSSLTFTGGLLTGPPLLDVAAASNLTGAGTILAGPALLDVYGASDLAGAGTIIGGPTLLDLAASSDLAVSTGQAGAAAGPGRIHRSALGSTPAGAAAGRIGRSSAGHIGTM